MKDLLILGIETSCDETSAAVVKGGRVVLSNVIRSQSEHVKFGGVVPELASRGHIDYIEPVVAEALARADVRLPDLGAVAVTSGAGLVGALLVGVNFAKGLAYQAGLPLVEVNHIQSHIAANYIGTDLAPPFLALAVSGGHTAIVEVRDYTDFRVVAATVDDAVGEAFDKVGRYLGFPYPSGAQIDKMSREGADAIQFTKYKPHKKDDDLISYSGLKTAAVNYIHAARQANRPLSLPDLCASFTRRALDPLIEKTLNAARKRNLRAVALAGGVAANTYLRQTLTRKGQEAGLAVLCPPPELCTDNAAMTAAQGYYNLRAPKPPADLYLNAKPSLRIEE